MTKFSASLKKFKMKSEGSTRKSKEKPSDEMEASDQDNSTGLRYEKFRGENGEGGLEQSRSDGISREENAEFESLSKEILLPRQSPKEEQQSFVQKKSAAASPPVPKSMTINEMDIVAKNCPSDSGPKEDFSQLGTYLQSNPSPSEEKSMFRADGSTSGSRRNSATHSLENSVQEATNSPSLPPEPKRKIPLDGASSTKSQEQDNQQSLSPQSSTDLSIKNSASHESPSSDSGGPKTPIHLLPRGSPPRGTYASSTGVSDPDIPGIKTNKINVSQVETPAPLPRPPTPDRKNGAQLELIAVGSHTSQKKDEDPVWKLINMLNSDPSNKLCADCRTPLLEISRMFCSFYASNHVQGVGMLYTRPNTGNSHISSLGSPTSSPCKEATTSEKVSSLFKQSLKVPPSIDSRKELSTPPKNPKNTRKFLTASSFNSQRSASSGCPKTAVEMDSTSYQLTSKSSKTELEVDGASYPLILTTHSGQDVEVAKIMDEHTKSEKKSTAPPHAMAPQPPLFGVFICQSCSQAHLKMGLHVCSVANLRTLISGDGWTSDDISVMVAAGGNVKSNAFLEHFIPPEWQSRVPSRDSTDEEREVFCRAKYEVFAFIYSNGPVPFDHRSRWNALLSKDAIHKLMSGGIDKAAEYAKNATNNSLSMAQMPSRLLDYFCVIGPASDEGSNLDPNATKVGANSFSSTQQSFRLDKSTRISARNILAKIHNSGDLPLHQMELETSVVDSYPVSREDAPIPSQISKFVFPDGCTPVTFQLPPQYFNFILTNESGLRMYGTALRVYDISIRTADIVRMLLLAEKEIESDNVSAMSSRNLLGQENIASEHWASLSSDVDSILGSDYCKNHPLLFLPKALVLVSHYPFHAEFLQSLKNLYHISLVEAPLPIERYICNLVEEVPLPPKGRVRVRYALSPSLPTVTFERPPMNDLPLVNYSYQPLFEALSVSNILVVFGLLLQETPVVICSSKSLSLLCNAAEAFTSFLFPLVWQCIYIPILPRDMLDVLQAPVPFLVGVYGNYLVEVAPEFRPPGVAFCDLDNDEIHLGTVVDTDGSLYGREVPALPEKEVGKLQAKLEEIVNTYKVYLEPPSGVKGRVTYGYGTTMPNESREAYALEVAVSIDGAIGVIPKNANSEASFISGSTRKAKPALHVLNLTPRPVALSRMDAAFPNDEHLNPVNDFLGELGSKFQVENASNETRSKRSKFKQSSVVQSSQPTSSRNVSEVNSKSTKTLANKNIQIESDNFPSRDVRAAFLRFFVSTLREYEDNVQASDQIKGPFDVDGFIKDSNHLNSSCHDFIKAMVSSQMFLRFIEERLSNSTQHEILLFDESITAKQNRSKASKILKPGYKKTSTPFLLDDSQKIKEIFAPPHPSNWGLPDDGRFYRYTSGFPSRLDVSLMSKIRPPKKWIFEDSGQYNEQRRIATPAYMQNSLFGTTACVTKSECDTSAERDVVWAIHVIVYMKHQLDNHRAKQKIKSARRSSPLKKKIAVEPLLENNLSEANVSASSELLGKTMLPVALALIDSARRKQTYPIGRVSKLQAIIRSYLFRKRFIEARWGIIRLQKKFRNIVLHRKYGSRFSYLHYYAQDIQRVRRGYVARMSSRKVVEAVVKIQSVVRMFLLKKYVTLLIKWAITMQSLYRGRRVRFGYGCVLEVVNKIQASIRGWVTRRIWSQFLKQRMYEYSMQIVELWERAHRPLVYRTKFWRRVQHSVGFRHLALYQDELVQLWTYLGLKPLRPFMEATSIDTFQTPLMPSHRVILTTNLDASTPYDVSADDLFTGRLGAKAQAIYQRFIIVQRKLDKVRSPPESSALVNLVPVFPSELNSLGGHGQGPLTTPSKQLMIERAELYEKLKYFVKPETLNRIFIAFHLSKGEKHKKDRVVNMICKYFY